MSGAEHKASTEPESSRLLIKPLRRTRGGFTLLETLLAISLVSVLMVAIVASTSLYVQYRSRSLEGSRHAKVFFGTVADLRSDLRACYEGDQSQVPLLNSRVGSQATTLANGEERVLTFSSNVTEQPIHFVGRRDAMLFGRRGLNPRFVNVIQESTAKDYQVLWLAPGLTSVRLPFSKQNERVTQRAFQSPLQRNGLQRMSLPIRSHSAETAFSFGVLGRNRQQDAWNVNEEIVATTFRYFDGIEWLPRWDSHVRNEQIPLAVEATLTLRQEPNRSLRVVIRLPGADGRTVELDNELQQQLSTVVPQR